MTAKLKSQFSARTSAYLCKTRLDRCKDHGPSILSVSECSELDRHVGQRGGHAAMHAGNVWTDVGKTGAVIRQIALLPVAALLAEDSPRLGGLDEAHARRLAESGADLPPILVDRRTLQVVDGMHRLRAAQLRGADVIEAKLADVPEGMAFVLAVEANIAHGLPLSLAERRSAAERIIVNQPLWSDRLIARVTGLAARTIGVLRRHAEAMTHGRVGLDGRVRPEDPAAARVRVAESIAARPDASLRQIAASAGVSPATARDVRQRLKHGDGPVPQGLEQRPGPRLVPEPAARPGESRASRRQQPVVNPRAVVEGLKRDPALRFSESGRAILRWATAAVAVPERSGNVLAKVPAQCRPMVAEMARAHAREWLSLADRLERRAAASA
ncbi:ParB N-terminal domain-containing protein [Dactylosporangium sp. NPDC048998]|uniref:ParB N-terminal domain-containing protein n=1 Tax=Dactylosporangium sp. NPDC048998 TaxID=3363976 RepID=UPI0037173A27